jgi:hypothetical protein
MKQDKKVWTGVIKIGLGTVAGFYEHGNELSVYIKAFIDLLSFSRRVCYM